MCFQEVWRLLKIEILVCSCIEGVAEGGEVCVNVPVVIIIYELPNFVSTEVSTVFYACYLLTCFWTLFGALFHVRLTFTSQQ